MTENNPIRGTKKNLSDDERQLMYELLLSQSTDGTLRHGSLINVSAQFFVCPRTASRLWRQVETCIEAGKPVNTKSGIRGKKGRKKVEIDPEVVAQIPLNRRNNLQSLAAALNIPKSTVHLSCQEGKLRRHTNAIKPLLNDENKRARLEFCLSKIKPSTINSNPSFDGMYDCVHIDEKWFNLTRISETYYLLPEELEPQRYCNSKKFITKVMFMAAVARPKWDMHGNEIFSGKIGIFPFVTKEPAKRKSKNREAGTLETKAMTSVNRDAIRTCLIEKVLPAICEESSSKLIYVQQDNAKPHILADDPAFLEAANKDGFEIKLCCQPPNSPDLNVLDLGFFNAIQSLQHQEAPKTIDELVAAVYKAFDNLDASTSNRVFLSLQLVMNEVINKLGGNDFRLKHIGKVRLERASQLPTSIPCDQNSLDMARLHLQNLQQ